MNPALANDAAVDAALSSVQASAGQRLSAAMSGGDDAPAAAPAPVPAPVVTAPAAQPATPPPVGSHLTGQTGSPPAGQAPATPGIDSSTLGAEARRYLEMFGGDANKALSKALADNNRLAEIHRPGDAGTPPPTQVTPPPATVQPEPPAPVVVDAQVVETEVSRLLLQDRECADSVSAFMAAQDRLNEIHDQKTGTGKVPTLEKAIQLELLRLEVPEIKADPVLTDEINDLIREHRTNLRDLRMEARDLKQEAREHRDTYNKRSESYAQRVRSVLEQRAAEGQRQADFDTASTRYMTELSQAWPTALKEAATAAGIPEALHAALEERVMDAADANLNSGLPVSNVKDFMTGIATKYAQEMDTHHRLKSGDYARLAGQRADLGGPPGTSGLAPTVPQPQPTDLGDVYTRSLARLKQGIAR